MTFELLADARTELDGAASLLTDVLGVGSARMHPHDNKFHVGNGEDGKHYWLTPPELLDQLAAAHGPFDFDPCPFPKPEAFDGLTCEWGECSYVNPPFGSILHQGPDDKKPKKKGPTAWARKAITEAEKGKRVVLVYPVDKWLLMLFAAGAKVSNLGDVRWHATEDGSVGKGTGRHIACFVLDGTKEPSNVGGNRQSGGGTPEDCPVDRQVGGG